MTCLLCAEFTGLEILCRKPAGCEIGRILLSAFGIEHFESSAYPNPSALKALRESDYGCRVKQKFDTVCAVLAEAAMRKRSIMLVVYSVAIDSGSHDEEHQYYAGVKLRSK